jgi:hypothetical protein
MKKKKLRIEKFQILRFHDLKFIKGGTDTTHLTFTVTHNSSDTTFTTDPMQACPDTVYSDTEPTRNDPSHTSSDTNNGSGVPTLNPQVGGP